MKKILLLVFAVMLLALTACVNTAPAYEPEISESMGLKYAQNFSVDYCTDGTALITIDSDRYLFVPEGAETPENCTIPVLQSPVSNIYMVSSCTMDMFASCGAMGSIGYSSLEASGWFVQEAVDAMNNGEIVYAGKYSAPDYELLKAGKCSLAVENTMILHSPEVKEKLEALGIPVIVDHSSYEDTPQGRMEWIKLYGLLTGHLEEAEEAFEEQIKYFDELAGTDLTGETAAFFYVTTAGTVSVRRDTDYIPKMIELSGGEYIFEGYNASSDSTSPTVNISMESFYAAAKDADYLIYNSSIAGEITKIDDLKAISPVFESFKAVQNGNVFCTGENLYQSSMELGEFIHDLYSLFHGEYDSMKYIFKLD